MDTKPLVVNSKVDVILQVNSDTSLQWLGTWPTLIASSSSDNFLWVHNFMKRGYSIRETEICTLLAYGPDSWSFAFRFYIQSFKYKKKMAKSKKYTSPTCSASSSSLLSLAWAASLASRNSFAVGNPVILRFSSDSYWIHLSLGDRCERMVETFK